MAPYRSPEYQTSFESIGLSVQEKNFNIDFQNGSHLGFQIRMILAFFDLQVTLILLTKFRVIWHFGSELNSSKQIFNMAARATILSFPSERF